MNSSDHPDPEELLCRARSGDNGAFGRLLELYRSYLMLFSRLQLDSRLQGKADPSDLVQETFVRAHESFKQFRGTTEGELLRWLRQILVSRLAKLVRRFRGTQQRDVRLERQLDDELERSSQAAQSLMPGKAHPARGPSGLRGQCW